MLMAWFFLAQDCSADVDKALARPRKSYSLPLTDTNSVGGFLPIEGRDSMTVSALYHE
jgi:hypothetical protein